MREPEDMLLPVYRQAVNRVLDSLSEGERRIYASFIRMVYAAGANGEPEPLVNVGNGCAQRAMTDRERTLMVYGDTSFARRHEQARREAVIGGITYWHCWACGQWCPCRPDSLWFTDLSWSGAATTGPHQPTCSLWQAMQRDYSALLALVEVT